MLKLTDGSCIFVAVQPVDMRRSFDGLCATIVEALGGVSTGENPGPSVTLLRDLLDQGYTFEQASELVQRTIPLNLAKDYANLLPQSESQAAFPNAQDIAQYHWDEFAKYGLPASTFGGTPFGRFIGPVLPSLWCPLCKSQQR